MSKISNWKVQFKDKIPVDNKYFTNLLYQKKHNILFVVESLEKVLKSFLSFKNPTKVFFKKEVDIRKIKSPLKLKI
ncbi:hypothetical protein [Candidatus Phytoplasma luffae]|uniref:hypothetical protein n=1 Tax=Loofah witches'-broom phytoplasma TaxID=35773 RepID=UPI001B36A322|nr:hypothetical protein [Candidatus Phytoplasma luffae]